MIFHCFRLIRAFSKIDFQYKDLLSDKHKILSKIVGILSAGIQILAESVEILSIQIKHRKNPRKRWSFRGFAVIGCFHCHRGLPEGAASSLLPCGRFRARRLCGFCGLPLGSSMFLRWFRAGFSCVFFNVSISTMPRSFSRAVSIEFIFSISEFFKSRSLVVDVTCFCASTAFICLFKVNAMAIWFFHNGIDVMMDDWIFSAKVWLVC